MRKTTAAADDVMCFSSVADTSSDEAASQYTQSVDGRNGLLVSSRERRTVQNDACWTTCRHGATRVACH